MSAPLNEAHNHQPNPQPTHRPATIVPTGGGHTLSWRGQPVRYLALGSETAGQYALHHAIVHPGDSNPPHRHPFAEAFYIVSGSVWARGGRQTVRLSAGDFLHIPGGLPHQLGNDSAEPAEMLVLVAPPGFDEFQFRVGEPWQPGQPAPFSPDEFVARMHLEAPRFGIELNLPESAFDVPETPLVRRSSEGELIDTVGDRYRFLATAAETGGLYAWWWALVPPGGGPPPHIHSREEESFYVLDGELTFWSDDQTATGGAGTFVNLPPGTRHRFQNVSDRPATMLALVAPGGMEELFRETGEAVVNPALPPPPPKPETIAKLLSIAPRYGITIDVPHH